jgi:cobalt-zinc-cadmium efflux system outer membrane protein
VFNVLKEARWLIVFASLLSASFTAQAQQRGCDLPQAITSEALVATALECSPGQQAVRSRWQAQQYRADAAGYLDDPRFSVSAAPRTFGHERLDDGYVAELSQRIPWPGTLSLQKRAAAADSEVWQARVNEHQVELARQIRVAFAEWQYHRQLLKINLNHQELWREFLAVVEAKYAAGTATKSTVLQAKHEAHLLMEQAIELEAKVERDASLLKQLVGLPVSASLASRPVEPFDPISLPEDTFALALQAIEHQPGMQRLDAEQASTATELALAEKDRLPSFSVMARYNSLWMNEEQRWMVGVGVNIPIDFGKRSSQEASIRAEEQALRWEQQDLVNALREELMRTHSLWVQGKETYELYQEELLPLSREHLTTALQAYQSGSDDFLALLIAQRQTLETQRKAEAAIFNQSAALAKLTAAAGLVWLDGWQGLEAAEPEDD